MSNIGNLERVSAAKLSELILAKGDTAEETLAVVDVRDGGKEAPRFATAGQFGA